MSNNFRSQRPSQQLQPSLQSQQLQTLAQNLRDINEISAKVTNEFKNKNNILKGGLNDCRVCRKYMQATKNNNGNGN